MTLLKAVGVLGTAAFLIGCFPEDDGHRRRPSQRRNIDERNEDFGEFRRRGDASRQRGGGRIGPGNDSGRDSRFDDRFDRSDRDSAPIGPGRGSHRGARDSAPLDSGLNSDSLENRADAPIGPGADDSAPF